MLKVPLVAQRKAVGHLLRIGLVKRFAKFTAVNFRVLPDPVLHFLRIVVPPLQVTGAKFSLGVLLIAGTLPGLAHFDLLFRWRRFARRRSRRGSGRRRGRNCGGGRGRGPRWCDWR